MNFSKGAHVAGGTEPVAHRVLVVDDEETIRELLADVLEAGGYEVATASDGLEALVEARRTHPDVILLDLLMPRMSGWDVLAEIEKDPLLAHVPVIISSVDTDGMDVGVALRKPYRMPDLLATLERVLGAPGDRPVALSSDQAG